jgi:hypothetical protein
MTSPLRLQHLFDTTEPGIYCLQARYHNPKDIAERRLRRIGRLLDSMFNEGNRSLAASALDAIVLSACQIYRLDLKRFLITVWAIGHGSLL